uniref:NADH-ubiquinone oxidoreductase chain 4 n=1 Tax=Scutogyrus longicornis TaxID=341066 RepID=A0A888YUY3_9PLAT|nr:NADH dehydrogenase subunit 4 [Scutogyrus longicornis]QRC77979.1 NADH dehydrogenase subunit 4 [Scutogyrus longicornis]
MVFSYVCVLIFSLLLVITQDCLLVNSYLTFDYVGSILGFICLFLMIFFLNFCYSHMSKVERILICVSAFFSVICFLSNNTMVFWVSYELAIISLVFCILAGSPYSERFLAFWYLVGYVGSTSVPLLLCILYVNFLGGSTSLSGNISLEGEGGFLLGVFMFILFATKVPLPPFHAWLPVVHAEASAFISVWLSGFIMKLGLIGIYRFVINLIHDNVDIFTALLCYSVFIIASCLSELDTKRWLAYLSLGHIIIALLGILNSDGNSSEGPLYCLGHGFSASLLFVCFLFAYDLIGSRNWFSFSIAGRLSVGIILMLCLSLLTASSFPPTLNFFSEVFILGLSFHSGSLALFYFFYLFVGGLIPVLILAYMVCSAGEGFGSGLPSFNLLVVLYVFNFVTYLFVFMI